MTKPFFLFAFLTLYLGASAQTTLPMPLNLKATYDKGTRGPDGAPGKKYWQNKADYILDINFEPSTRLLSGTESLAYYNTSPDTLKEILFKLYPNLYKKGSPRGMKIDDKDATDGMVIEKLLVDNEEQDVKKLRIDATNMSVRIKPLAPGQSIRFYIKYNYTLNKGSHIRTGQVDEGAFFIAYFFPRVAVYDDIDGWNRNPYLGTAEFYNDFCKFKTTVTVPNDYLVWATGELNKPEEVLTQKYAVRLKQARLNAANIHIINSS